MALQIPKTIDFVEYYQRVGIQESQDLHWGHHWRDKLVDRLTRQQSQQGAELPWSRMRDAFRLRPGETTLWAGEDGHRKSLIVGQAMLYLARRQRVCLMSFEMPPEDTLLRMCRQAAGVQTPSVAYADVFSRWTDERVAIYDQLDTVASEKVLGVTYYAALELGCEHIVIDSLMKCGYDIDDYPAQVRFADQLSRTAKALNVHLHLIHHMKKPGSHSEDHSKSRIHGSSQLINNFHNCVTIWFNERRYEALQAQEKGAELTERQQTEIDKKHDQILTIRKQRNGVPFKSFGFYFDESSLQLIERDGQRYQYDLSQDEKLPGPEKGEEYVPGAAA